MRRGRLIFSSVALLVCYAVGWAQGPLVKDISKSYSWRPVRIGAGGFVTGFVSCPADPHVRVARTDVGNAYMWDVATSEWKPLKVVNPDGSGFPKAIVSAPGGGGVQSIAIDPRNPKVLYIACPINRSADIGPSTGINIYRSVDGGHTFKPGDLDVPGDPNDGYRTMGERLAVDPLNDKVLFYGSGFGPGGSQASGLYRSIDSGEHWSPVLASNAFLPTDNLINVLIDPSAGRIIHFRNKEGAVCRRIWVRGGHMVKGIFASDVYLSNDGGRTWSNQSFGTGLAGKVGEIFLKKDGTLFAIQSDSKRLWKYAQSRWSTISVDAGDNLNGLAIDPKNSNRMFAIGNDGSVSRTLDGGSSWVNLGRFQYANRLGWLPQVVGNAQAYGYRANAGISFDADGVLWVSQGNEGILHYLPSADNSESPGNPPKWVIDSKGIEEFVTQDVVIPKGSDDQLVAAVADATGLVLPKMDQFGASQIPLQSNLISQGTQVAWCPNDPKTVVVSTSNVYQAGRNESGISFDSGEHWTKFGTSLKYSDSWGTHDLQAGSIAISRRGEWKQGDDHIVQLPVNNFVPIFSRDGGRTWKATKSFPMEANGLTFKNGSGYQGFWIFALKQRCLYADPFVSDRFYLKLTNSPDELYVSDDGGQTWVGMKHCGLPINTHHGQLAVNHLVANDLWFVDGFEGASEHGLFHSTDGGKSFVKVSGFSNAITLALGVGDGKRASIPYSVYVYGKRIGDADWGVFRSTDSGSSWKRISYFPGGIFDQPTCMAASWDTFGTVVVGFTGNSYVYGKLVSASLN